MRLRIVARNGIVAIEGGRIVPPDGRFDVTLRFERADIRPGLINAHDHLHRNHYGRLGRPPYRNAYDWAHDIQARFRDHIAVRRTMPRREALLVGAWKNLFAGVTSVVHHDPWEEDFDRDFPLRVVRIANADSLGMSPGFAPPDAPYCLHLAEGIDAAAADEVRILAAAGHMSPHLIAVHGVGVDGDGIARLRASGAGLVWCPSSNHFLFGRTAPAELLRDGLDVMLGSDSRLTGDGDLLDEMRRARATALLDDERLSRAVSETPARRLGLSPPSLVPGVRADIVVLARPLLEASAADVLLVVAGGVVRVAHPELAGQLNRLDPQGALMRMGSVIRWTSGRTERAP